MASYQKNETTGRWYVAIYLGKHPETGKARFVGKQFGKGAGQKKEAEAWAKKLEVQRDEGLYKPSLTKATLASYLLDTWLPIYRKQVRSTYTTETVLNKWIVTPQPNTPFLGAKLLRKLTVSDFDKLYTAMDEQGKKDRTIKFLGGMLRSALKSAVVKGELPRNPTDGQTYPKTARKDEITCAADETVKGKVRYLSAEQTVRILDAANKTRLSALWHLLVDAGLRPGEAFALKWRHLNVESKLVEVRGTLARVHNEARKKRGDGWMITPPKTDSSNRDVPVRDETIKQLALWKAHQRRMGLGRAADDFIFTTELGTPLGSNIENAWMRLLKVADGGKGDLGTWGPDPKKPKTGPTAERSFTPRYSMYVTRHTCATLLLLGGMPLENVSRRLGHKDIGITDRFYSHVQSHDTTQAAEIFDRILERKLALIA